ncbi:DNA-binding transcriptional regulator FabR, partial [Erwinia amylovora]|nr:DNA-binding transcriptional regulator FabR [Erwinia amylovora]
LIDNYRHVFRVLRCELTVLISEFLYAVVREIKDFFEVLSDYLEFDFRVTRSFSESQSVAMFIIVFIAGSEEIDIDV